MGATWSFDKSGFSAGVKEFFVSAVKSALVAVGAYVLMRLGSVHIDAGSQNAEIFTALIVVGRGLVSAFLKWVNTSEVTSTVTTEVVAG